MKKKCICSTIKAAIYYLRPKEVTALAGFLTQYLFGMESFEKLPENYIKNVIQENNHPFLIGLQGYDLFSFNPHTISKRGLSYQTASGVRGQEYGALINSMLDHIENLQGRERSACVSYMAGFLCYYALNQAARPYISYFAGHMTPAGSSRKEKYLRRLEIEAVLDTVLLRTNCHMEPSQLNFEALTFISRRDLAEIEKLLRYAVRSTYKISSSELATGLRNLRRSIICLQQNTGFRKVLIGSVTKILPLSVKRIYIDFIPDEHDYMNTEGRPWLPCAGCSRALHSGFHVIYEEAIASSLHLLESLDSCISWGMNRDELISDIIGFDPYADIM